MPEKDTGRHIAAVCGECGQPVFFGQLDSPPTIMAVCSSDPEHTIGPTAQQILGQTRRDHRAR
jgi:hypothetical protein